MKSLVHLLQIASPALPIGGYSYSQGLEWMVVAAAIRDASSARSWIAEMLDGVMAHGEAPVLIRLCAFAHAGDWDGFARAVRVGPHLRLGRGEEATGGRERELLLASAFEAVLGALYVDGGLRATRRFLEPLLRQEAARAIAGKRIKDDKSRLQERAQAQLGVTPSYRVVSESGPSHDRTFVVEVLLGERAVAHGEGRSKRQAEQEAARAALADPGWQVEE